VIHDLIWDTVKNDLYISKEQFFADWTVVPHSVNGEVVMAMMIKDSEFHFTTFGKAWALTRADIHHYLAPIIARHGFVTTRTPLEDTRQHRFNKLLGFKAERDDGIFTYYKLSRLRHA